MYSNAPGHCAPRLLPPRRAPRQHPATPATCPRARQHAHHSRAPTYVSSQPTRALRPPAWRAPAHHPRLPLVLLKSADYG